jgi:hypothetical protein
MSKKKTLPTEPPLAPRPEPWINGNSTAVLAPTPREQHPAVLSFGVGVTAAGENSSAAALSGSAHQAESAVDVAVVVGETIKAIDGRWALEKDTGAAQALAQRGERLRAAVFCLSLLVLMQSLQL